MKYLVIFVVCFIALASANLQLITTWPGLVAPLGSRTVIAGPTVINGGLSGFGDRIVSPGYITTGLI